MRTFSRVSKWRCKFAGTEAGCASKNFFQLFSLCLSGPEQNRTAPVQKRTGRLFKAAFQVRTAAKRWQTGSWGEMLRRRLQDTALLESNRSGIRRQRGLRAPRIGEPQAHWLHAENSGGLGTAPPRTAMRVLVPRFFPGHAARVKKHNSSIACRPNLSARFSANSTRVSSTRPLRQPTVT